MKSIRDLAIEGRRTFLRVDFNVPLAGGNVMDATRIVETMPTIRHAVERGARLVCASHLGKPKGQRKPELSLAPVSLELARQLGRWQFGIIDCQMATSHLASLGAREIRRSQFIRAVSELVNYPAHPGTWRFDDDLFD